MNKLPGIIALFLVVTNFCYAEINTPPKLLVERASLMQGVGICKAKFKSPIYDSAQELRVLQNAENLAEINNLDKATFLIFIQFQMDLSKQIEDYYWKNATPKQIEQEKAGCLADYRNKITEVDKKLYSAISENLELIKKDREIDLQLKKLVEKANIKGIPQDIDYISLLASSLQNIKFVKSL